MKIPSDLEIREAVEGGGELEPTAIAISIKHYEALKFFAQAYLSAGKGMPEDKSYSSNLSGNENENINYQGYCRGFNECRAMWKLEKVKDKKLLEAVEIMHDKFLYMRSYLEIRMSRKPENELDIALNMIEFSNQVIADFEKMTNCPGM